MTYRIFTVLLIAIFWFGAASAQTSRTINGTDSFVAGEAVSRNLSEPGDAFVAGRTVVVDGSAAKDLHASGLDVVVDGNTGGDLYAAGLSVTVSGNVAEDATVFGNAVRLDPQARIDGNGRFFGGTVTVDGVVDGSLSVFGRSVVLNAPVAGDVLVYARTLELGEGARISGALRYSTDNEISIPEGVIPASRVTYEEPMDDLGWHDFEEMWQDERPFFWPTFMSVFLASIVTLAFLVLLGGLCLTFFPKQVSSMRHHINDRPFNSVLLGVIGLSIVFGMVPILGMTIVGLPFLPFVLLAIIVLWTLGYLLGGYAIAMRTWIAFGGADQPPLATRLLALAAAVVLIALLNYIPFVGWVVNFTLVLLGVGAMTNAAFQMLFDPLGQSVDSTGPANFGES